MLHTTYWTNNELRKIGDICYMTFSVGRVARHFPEFPGTVQNSQERTECWRFLPLPVTSRPWLQDICGLGKVQGCGELLKWEWHRSGMYYNIQHISAEQSTDTEESELEGTLKGE